MPNRADTKDSGILLERLAGRVSALEDRVHDACDRIEGLTEWKDAHDIFASKASTEYATGIADLGRRLDEGLKLNRSNWDKLMSLVIDPIIKLAMIGALVEAVAKMHR